MTIGSSSSIGFDSGFINSTQWTPTPSVVYDSIGQQSHLRLRTLTAIYKEGETLSRHLCVYIWNTTLFLFDVLVDTLQRPPRMEYEGC
jgi:hypothetical protein